MIRIGILGAARIAPRGIVTPANELLGTEVVAVASRDLSRARDFAAEHSIPMAFGSMDSLARHNGLTTYPLFISTDGRASQELPQ